jgi:hypothetical protein
MKFCEVENSVNLEDVEMADSVGKQASLAGSLGPQTALKFCCSQNLHGNFVAPEVDRERKKKKKD